MPESPTTRLSLLARLRDPADAVAWSEFVRLYAPLVHRYGRRRGLQDSDAADLAQEVLTAVSAGARRLEDVSRNGSFRAWLFAITRHKLADLLRRRPRCAGSGDDATLELLREHPGRAEEDLWDVEYRNRVFAWSAERVRGRVGARSWEAFWRTAVGGEGPAQVAESLAMSVAAVYLARSRVMARLREEIRLAEPE